MTFEQGQLVLDIVLLVLLIIIYFWVIAPMQERLEQANATIIRLAQTATDRILANADDLHHDTFNEEVFIDWQATYNAAITGLYSQGGNSHQPDDVHSAAVRIANTAHGPCPKRPS